ncbi:MAG: hypothetical protein Q8896_14565, partial [Bacteroidota bacterium]|nr:hypothetical protein [Bacteroidota bacterium]
IRIRVSLSDVTEHKQIWSEKYDGTFDDIFDFQEKTAIAITEALRLTLTPEEEKKVEHRPTQNPEAYELYLKGEEYYSRSTRADLEHALGLYEEAFRYDPKFVEAIAMVATTSQSLYRLYSRNQSWLTRADEALRKVFEIEGRTARYYGISSAVHFVCGRFDLALADARQAIELDSNYVQGYAALGTACQLLGDKEGAVAAWEKVVSINENDRHAHFGLIIVLSELQQPEYLRAAAQRALPIYERYLKLNPGDDNARVEYATILESAGKIEESIRLADELALNTGLDGFLLYNLCCLYMHCGRQEKAMEMLTRSIRNGHINLEHIRRDPDLEPLRDLPEFQVLMEELGERSKLKES